MTIYVDDYKAQYRNRNGRGRAMIMSHMMSDESVSELVKFAERIGLDHRWIQHLGLTGSAVHFDVCLASRRKAIEAGAVELPIKLPNGRGNPEWKRVVAAAKKINSEYSSKK